MFEKGSEEYVRKIRHDVINWDGAEPEERFYNEIKFKQAYQQGAEFGYNKVNEWHDLQDNPSDLPKNREKVLLLVKLNDKWNRTEVLIGYRDFGDCLGGILQGLGIF